MLIPILLGAAALAAAGYLLAKYLLRKKREKEQSQQPKSQPQPQKKQSLLKQLFSDPEISREEKSRLVRDLWEDLRDGAIPMPDSSDISSPGHWDALPRKYDPIADLWKEILKIAAEIRFYERVVNVTEKVGEEKVNTKIPSGEIEIVQLSDLADLPKALMSELGADDEVFYSRLANKEVLIQQPIEYIGVYQDKQYRLRKTLRWLQDVSGSTKADRITWSKIMSLILLKKAEHANAEAFLTTFNGDVCSTIHASPEETGSYEEAKAFINREFYDRGGTDIDGALRYEFDRIEEENRENKTEQSTQIVLVTDGTQDVSQSHITRKLTELKVTLHTVVLGTVNQGLQNVSHRYHYLHVPQHPSV